MAELKIIIQDETSSSVVPSYSGTTTIPQNQASNATPKTAEGHANTVKVKAMAVASMVAQQSFNYVTSNVGKWTGNSRKQTQVNNIMQLASIAASAYISPALAIAQVGINLATTAMDTSFEQKWDARKANQARLRAGYNSSGQVVGRRH